MRLARIIAPIVLISLFTVPPAFSKVEFISPFPSTVPGLDIPNAHLVDQAQGQIYRGMSPDGKASLLKSFGITDILIFKENYKGEVQDEISELEAGGFTANQIYNIPFHWDEMSSFQESCGQVVQALSLLETAYRTKGRKLYFHCTVGEDRTGLLAGLFRMINDGIKTEDAFGNEMCAHGYEAGNPQKPAFVDATIRQILNPVFFSMAKMIEDGALTADHLDPAVCSQYVPSQDFITAAQARHCPSSSLYLAPAPSPLTANQK